MRTLAPLIALSIVFASLAIPQVGSLPMPGENDAGSGMDAGDSAQLAMPIGEGAFEGNLTHIFDETDAYRFSSTTIGEVSVNARAPPGVFFQLVDSRNHEVFPSFSPDPNDRNFTDLSNGSSSWTLVVGYGTHFQAGGRDFYTFSINSRPFDHYARVEGGNTTADAFTFHLPPGAAGGVKLYYAPDQSVTPFTGNTEYSIETLRRGDGPCLPGFSFDTEAWSLASIAGRNGFEGGSLVWMQNGGFHAAASPLPLSDQTPAVLPGGTAYERFPAGNMTWSSRIAGFPSLGTVAELIWDGPADGVLHIYPKSKAILLTAADFTSNASSIAVQAGPLAYVNDMTARFDVPNATTSSAFAIFDATTPGISAADGSRTRLAASPTTGRLIAPNGSAEEIEDGIVMLSTIPVGPFERLDSGAWTSALKHVDGTESDHPRLLVGTFPLGSNCGPG